MQPSTYQTMPGASLAGLPAGLLVVAGSAGLFVTYWDDAWHTDLGRDQPTIPPHLLLYATDLPQFSEALYLPVLLAAALVAAWVLRQDIPGPLPVVRAVGIYVLVQVAITLGLAGLGRSTPDLPLAILGLASVDTGAVALLAVPAVVVFLAVVAAQLRWSSQVHGAALLLLALILRQVRGPARVQPVLHAARPRGAATHGGGVGHGRAPGRLGS